MVDEVGWRPGNPSRVGFRGQFIFVVPGMDLVVVITSDADATRDGGHNRELHRILEEEIISPAPFVDSKHLVHRLH